MSESLPYTGERYTPECSREIAHEHWHRYAFARSLARGRRVLDAACGEGYGSALLARDAAGVLGVDVDADCVGHARRRYAAVPGLRFERADATALEALAAGSFDLIVSFETLEHVEAQERLLDGFARLLAPEGILLVSTPDRDAYNEHGEPNPHHRRELDRGEFEALLAARFAAVRLFGQKLLFQSVLWDLATDAGAAEASTFVGAELRDGLRHRPVYHLAACARRPELLAALPALSLHGDAAEPVYAEYRAEVRRNRAAAAHIAHLEAELSRLRGRGDG